MRDTDYEFIRKLIYEHSRINLGPNKRELVSARLTKRLRDTQFETITEYCNFLQQDPDKEELSHLIDAISTNHTYFLREESHFKFLRDVAVPEIAKRRAPRATEPFHAWSAACSSGEEPYSLGIVLTRSLSKVAWPLRIEATDISNRILSRAKDAIYPEAAVSKMPEDWRRDYFQKGFGPHEGNYRVKKSIRELVHFHQLNLLSTTLPFNDPFHIIFCRNVMIYFDKATQEELVNKLSDQLLPGGYLMVGHSESLAGIRHPLKNMCPATYQKRI